MERITAWEIENKIIENKLFNKEDYILFMESDVDPDIRVYLSSSTEVEEGFPSCSWEAIIIDPSRVDKDIYKHLELGREDLTIVKYFEGVYTLGGVIPPEDLLDEEEYLLQFQQMLDEEE